MLQSGDRVTILFLMCTFAFSWILWIIAIFQGTSTAFAMTNILYLTGVFGPSLSGVLMVLCFYGPFEKRTFFRRIIIVPHNCLPLLGTVMVVIPFMVFISRSLSGILGWGNPMAVLLSVLAVSPWNIIPILFFILLLGPVSEELGWRGFFTDSMIQRFNFFTTAALTGLIWGIWHIPLFYIPGSGQNAMGILTLGFWVFFTTPVVFSFLLLFLYMKTMGSIAAAILVHFSINMSLAVFPLNSGGYGLFTAFLAVLVALLYKIHSGNRIEHP